MTLTETSIALAVMTLAGLALFWILVTAIDEPDPMEEEHGDVPHMEARHD